MEALYVINMVTRIRKTDGNMKHLLFNGELIQKVRLPAVSSPVPMNS